MRKLYSVTFAMIAIFIMICAFSAKKEALIYIDNLQQSLIAINENSKVVSAPNDGKLRFTANINVTADASYTDEFVLGIAGKGLELDLNSFRMFLKKPDYYLVAPNLEVKKNSQGVFARLNVNGTFLMPGQVVTLYFEADKTSEFPELSAAISSPVEKKFTVSNSIFIEGYSIKKQGKGAALTEVAIGIATMTTKDTVYIISKDSKEIFRVILKRGEVLGLAIEEEGSIVGIEYNLGKKSYVSLLSGKSVLSKEQVLQVFNDLGFSFMSPPYEKDWLASQDGYYTMVSLQI